MENSQIESLIAELRDVNYQLGLLNDSVRRSWYEIVKAIECSTAELVEEHERLRECLTTEQLGQDS